MDNHTDNHATYHMVKNGFWKDPTNKKRLKQAFVVVFGFFKMAC